MLLVSFLLAGVAGCPGGGNSPLDKPDAAVVAPPADAPPPPNPDAPPLKGYGQPCTAANQCAGGLCIGETGSQFVCSIPCNIEVANDCRQVDGFCVPIGAGDHGCFGTSEKP